MIDCKEPDLDEEEQELESNLARSFFELPKATREKIQEQIPLVILQRLKNIRNRDQNHTQNFLTV